MLDRSFPAVFPEGRDGCGYRGLHQYRVAGPVTIQPLDANPGFLVDHGHGVIRGCGMALADQEADVTSQVPNPMGQRLGALQPWPAPFITLRARAISFFGSNPALNVSSPIFSRQAICVPVGIAMITSIGVGRPSASSYSE